MMFVAIQIFYDNVITWYKRVTTGLEKFMVWN